MTPSAFVPAEVLAVTGRLVVGIRPEYVTLASPDAPGAVPATVVLAHDIGTYWLVTASVGQLDAACTVRARLNPDAQIPAVGDAVWLAVVGPHTCFYADDVLITATPQDARLTA